jgi:ribonuclease-3
MKVARRRPVRLRESDRTWHDAALAAGVPVEGENAADVFRLAFTHRSAAPKCDRNACNERLEFLGDAVISAAVSRYLFDRFPDQSEGFLSDMRSKLVRGKTLATIAERLGLDAALTISPEARRDRVIGDTKGGVHDPAAEDLFEAVVGAVSICSGPQAASRWVIGAIERVVDVSDLVKGVVSSRSALQREARTAGIADLSVRVKSIPGGAFRAVTTADGAVVGVGDGPNSKVASEMACAAARTYLGLAR